MRSLCVSSLKTASNKFLTKCSKGKSEVGIAAIGLSLVSAQAMIEQSERTRTNLEGHSVAALDERSRLAEEVFFEYLTRPLGVGEILQKKFSELRHGIAAGENAPKQQTQMKTVAKFPTLQTKLLTGQNKEEESFVISADEPLKIDNELFYGQVMLVLRPASPEDDPKYEKRIIEDNVTFQIQFQGKFKRPIQKDRLYAGAQLGGDMNLGIIAKKASQLILSLLSNNIDSNISYSFGSGTELPHISFPLHKGMDDVVVSDGLSDCPPQMGTHFVESEESKIQRRTKDYFEDWDTEGIYSMSYHARSIDLPSWKILLPFEMDLSRFWGDSPLRIVIYEEKEGGLGKEYLFNLQIKHLPTSL